MKLLPLAAHKGAVGGVLHQRVLEYVDCIGRSAPDKYQFGAMSWASAACSDGPDIGATAASKR